MAVAIVEIAQLEQRVDALGARLADADQETRRHGHARFAREPERFQAHRRLLVGRPEMRSAALAQTLRRAFEHEPLRNRNLAQRGDVRRVEHAGIEVRKQPRLVEDCARSLSEIGQRRRVPELSELFARDAVAQFRLVAEREERLLAAGGAPARAIASTWSIASDRLARPLRGAMRERAVVAHVPAKLGERNENLARIRHDGAVRRIAFGDKAES